MAKNKQAELNNAISEAHIALEDVDEFDVDSNNKMSLLAFNRLVKIHDKALAKVVKLAKEF